MISEIFYERLSLLSANVYLGAAPLDYEAPAVTYSRVNTAFIDDLDGQPDSAFVDYQVSVFDTDYLTARELADTIRNDLVAWLDDDLSVTVTNDFDAIDETTATMLHQIILRFRVFASV